MTKSDSAGASGAGAVLNDARSELAVAINAARLASPVIEGPHGQRHILVPDGYRIEAAHDPYALPPRIGRTRVEVDSRDAFQEYVERFKDPRTILVADYDAGSIVGYLDWHGASSEGLVPGPVSHICTLRLRQSEEFSRWSEFEGKLHTQEAFALFLEENAVDVVDPDPAVFIEISRDLEGTQGVTFKSSTRLENGDRSFVYETETRARGDIKVPRQFSLNIPLVEGELQQELICGFRWQVSGGELRLGFVWRRVEYRRRAHFAELASMASEELDCPVFFGRVQNA